MKSKLIGSSFNGDSKWEGGTLANDGNIYALPYQESRILKINTTDDSTSILEEIDTADLGLRQNHGYKWCGSVLGPDNCIYGVPSGANKILKFDPRNMAISLVGDDLGIMHHLDDEHFPEGLSHKYRSAVVGPDRKIYFIPYDARRVLQFDTTTEATTLIGDDFGDESNKWCGGVLANDNCIYCIPSKAEKVLIIDALANSTTKLMERDLGTFPFYKWEGGVLGHDGCIYGAPHEHNRILKIDVVTKRVSLIKFDYQYDNHNRDTWSGACLGKNNHIYFLPQTARRVLMFNPINGKTQFLDNDIDGEEFKWRGGVLGSTGQIYAIPFHSKRVLKIDTINIGTTVVSESLSVFINSVKALEEKAASLERENMNFKEKNYKLIERNLYLKEKLRKAEDILSGKNFKKRSVAELEEVEEKLGKALKIAADFKVRKFADEQAQKFADEQATCVICLTEKKSLLFRPCNHLCVCDTCGGKEEVDHCPVCRVAITEKISGIFS